MQPASIEHAIRLATYQAYFAERSGVGLHELRTELGADETPFEEAVDRLTDRGLIKAHAMGWYYKITPFGILSAEDEGVVDSAEAGPRRSLRTRITEHLMMLHESQRNHPGQSYETIAVELSVTAPELLPNLLLLAAYNYVGSWADGIFRINKPGMDAVVEWRRKTAILQEFEGLTNLQPQTRGRGFQKLFAQRVEEDGWATREGARSSNEEMDVLVVKDHHYYLIECKWLKAPVGAEVVRELSGKLANRVGIGGIVVSMSGFTKGAVKEVEDKAGQQTILLFGPKDVRAMFEFTDRFSDLLNQKREALIVQRKAIYK